MQLPMLDFIFFFFFSLLSISINNHRFMLANTIPNFQHPRELRSGNESDYEALLAIKSQISNDPDSVLSSWNNNNSLHFCQWRGVTCGHRHNRVVSLDLSSSNLVGTLSPFIGNLSFLCHLDLSVNSFRGNIPTQISHLIRLQYLSMKKNFFQGEIPSNLSRCLKLTFIDLYDNRLGSRIPNELANLPNLEYLRLSQNNLTGQLGDIGIGNMSISLKKIGLYNNHLQGSIPYDIGRLKGLISLDLSYNILSNTIPTSIFNLSNLIQLFLGHNGFHGHLPKDLGLTLPQLRKLSIYNNFLTGQVPTSLSNLSKIEYVDISYNSFTGRFSLNGNKLPHLMWLDINEAYPFGTGQDLSFVDTLTNCTNLTTLSLGGNSFIGAFPNSILNLSTSLYWLELYSNHLSGQLPPGLGKFVNLYAFEVYGNYFTGPIPYDIGMMKSVVFLYFDFNNFSGEIPASLGNMSRLSELRMYSNNLQGSLPKRLGNCQYLEMLAISNNKLNGVLPIEILHISSLTKLWIDQNNLRGSLPLEISMLKNLVLLDVSGNRFSGEIPATLGGCTSLKELGMNGNSFVGSIPESLSALKSIEYLDLSSNNLSGQIPSYFSTWPYLYHLNLSFNNLEGQVPLNGVFANTTALSIVGNSKLCGGVPELHLRSCPSPREPRKRSMSLAMIVIISIACVSIVTLSVALCLYLLCSSRKRKDASLELQNAKPFPEVSFQMLAMATDGFSASNLIGIGAFGSVYKGILIQDDTELPVAVKVMNLQNKRASKSFIVECNALKNIRHRNLVKIITVCSSIDPRRNDFKALVYEFMPRGSLDSWLHSNFLVSTENVGDDQSCSLSLLQRLSIAIDVASAVEYLHIGCDNQIIHCDLKPTNILLDDDMTARVGDFGLAKFLSEGSTSGATSQTSSTQVRGTVGYASPEYGIGSKVSPEGDIYSFGIVVLEMMTSKKPTDPMFNDNLNLHDYSKSALPDRVMEIVDQRMLGDTNVLHPRNTGDVMKIECIKSLIMIGVKCSTILPQERMSISDAVNELKSARQNILSGGPGNNITIQ